MASPTSSVTLRDFSGGLNLRRDSFLLRQNESPEIVNMDVDPVGGFTVRGGIEAALPTLPASIHTFGQFHKLTGADQYIAGAGTSLYYSTGSTWTAWATQANSSPNQMVQWAENLYVQNGFDQPAKWTGIAPVVRLGQTYSNDKTTPTTGNMPIGKCVAVHNGHIFVANTLESATRFPNRLRWSHPGKAEAFHVDDWVDVDPGTTGDEILALVPIDDHMLIFKQNSVHILYGFDSESFSIQTLTTDTGVCSRHAVVKSQASIWFFGTTQGVMRYDGKSLTWEYEKLWPLITEQKIADSRVNEVRLGWLNNRLWVSTPIGQSDSTVYVFDPTVKNGAWVQYDIQKVGPMMTWVESNGHYRYMITRNAIGNFSFYDVDKKGTGYDLLTYGSSTPTAIQTSYRTSWIDLGDAAIAKRWKKPYIVYSSPTSGSISVSAYMDYNGSDAKRGWQEALTAPPAIFYYDDPGVDYDDPGLEYAAEAFGGPHDIKIGGSLGSGRALQLRFRGPTDTSMQWGVDSISVSYKQRRLR